MTETEVRPEDDGQSGQSSGGCFAQFLRRLVILAALVLFWFISNYTIKVTHDTIYTDKVSEEIKLMLISDLHGTDFGSNNTYLLSKIRDEKPDAVLIAGDMYTRDDDEGMDEATSLMTAITCPVYFVCGEHDEYYDYTRLNNGNVHILNPYENYNGVYKPGAFPIASDTLIVRGNLIDIVGVNYFDEPYNIAEYAVKDKKRFTIVLSHILSPEAVKSYGADLSLSGDTHGGIVRLPLLGPAYYDNTWFPRVNDSFDGEIYDKGMFSLGATKAYVSAGLGAYPAPVRLFNRPEINVITIAPNK